MDKEIVVLQGRRCIMQGIFVLVSWSLSSVEFLDEHRQPYNIATNRRRVVESRILQTSQSAFCSLCVAALVKLPDRKRNPASKKLTPSLSRDVPESPLAGTPLLARVLLVQQVAR